jgi:hypothetical protein
MIRVKIPSSARLIHALSVGYLKAEAVLSGDGVISLRECCNGLSASLVLFPKLSFISLFNRTLFTRWLK